MKYDVSHWMRGGKVTSYSVGPPLPRTGIPLTDVQHTFVATFPVHPPDDAERTERAYMLAKKLCDFLNEFEEKKQQVADLMKIAAS